MLDRARSRQLKNKNKNNLCVCVCACAPTCHTQVRFLSHHKPLCVCVCVCVCVATCHTQSVSFHTTKQSHSFHTTKQSHSFHITKQSHSFHTTKQSHSFHITKQSHSFHITKRSHIFTPAEGGGPRTQKLRPPWWMESQGCQGFLQIEPIIGQNIALYARPAVSWDFSAPKSHPPRFIQLHFPHHFFRS